MERDTVLKKSIQLSYTTLGWYVIQAVFCLLFGLLAGSIALTGFGLTSILLAASAGCGLRKALQMQRAQRTGEEPTPSERKMLFGVGIAFFLLLLYVLNESGSRLYYREKPDPSVPGIVLVAVSLVVTAALSIIKFRTARSLESYALRRDALETAISIYVPIAIGAGLVLNYHSRLWWADPVSALLMLPLLFRRGWAAVEDSKSTAYGSGTIRLGS